jgi:hypothetical protein
MDGQLPQKTISKAYPTKLRIAVEILIPIVLGSLALLAHARYRSNINIPGHHGIVFMALLLLAFKSGKTKWSPYFFSIGIAAFSFMPFLGFKTPLVALIYVLPGVVFGILSNGSSITKYKVVFYALTGGLAYGSIPLMRFVFGLMTGAMHKSVLAGPHLPFILFFLFGLAGSFIGLGAYFLAKRIFK